MRDRQTIRACPRCFAENSEGPHSFLAFDPINPDVVICEKVHGEMLKTEGLKGPEFYISHYELPEKPIDRERRNERKNHD